VTAQSLGEAAAREDKRKKKAPASAGRVYTEEDLRPGSLSADAKPSPAPKATPQPATTPAPAPTPDTDDAAREAQKAVWRGRADQARREIAAAEVEVRGHEARVEELRNDRGTGNAMDPFRLQTLQSDLAAARASLEAARAKVTAARQRLDELEEEARRAGVPPGWLRER
jgi:hypothetical protein